MNFEQFKKYIITMVEMQTKRKVELQNIRKNNDRRLTAMSFVNEEKNSYEPVMYLELFYEDYLRGESIEKVLKHILVAISETENLGAIDIEFVFDYEQIKDKIMYRVINAAANERFLRTVPHEYILDLAKVFYINITLENGRTGMLTINNRIFKNWNVTMEEISKAAERNTVRLLPVVIKSMEEIMLHNVINVGDKECVNELCEEVMKDEPMEIYVVTNKAGCQGAAAMFYPEVIKQFLECKQGDWFILPSSIHEVLLVPYGNMQADIFREMVKEVNSTAVAPEEVLSNNVYYYRRETDNIEIA